MPSGRHFVAWADDHIGVALVAPTVGILGALAFYPVAGSLWLSLHGTILSLPSRGEPFVGLDNYRDLVGTSAFWHSLATTLVFVAVSTTLETVLGLGAALCLHQSFRGRGAVRAAMLVPWAVPTVVASQMWRFLLNDRYGPVSYFLFGGSTPLASPRGALGAVIAADVWKTTPFAALVLLAGLQSIPRSLDEAAAVDGAGRLSRLVHVTLPLLRPVLSVVVLFRTIDAFRVFDLVFVMTQGGPADGTNVLQHFGYRRSFSEGLVGSGAAVSTIIFLLSASASVFYVRLVGAELWRGRS